MPGSMTSAEVEGLLRAFEDGSWPYDQWHHAQHLAIATCYLRRHPREEAARRMILGVMNYNKARVPGAPPCHVSLTLSWITILAFHLKRLDRGQDLGELAGEVLREFGSDPLLGAHYTKDQLFTRGGTRSWLGPDLKPLPEDPPLSALEGLPPQPLPSKSP